MSFNAGLFYTIGSFNFKVHKAKAIRLKPRWQLQGQTCGQLDREHNLNISAGGTRKLTHLGDTVLRNTNISKPHDMYILGI